VIDIVAPVLGRKAQNRRAHQIEIPICPFQFVRPVHFQVISRERIKGGQALLLKSGDAGQKLDVRTILGVVATQLGDDDVVQLDCKRG
jgi:hypothetical protein